MTTAELIAQLVKYAPDSEVGIIDCARAQDDPLTSSAVDGVEPGGDASDVDAGPVLFINTAVGMARDCHPEA